MSVILAIKRSQTANTPSSLANGEMAYSFSSDKLFIGQTNTAGSAVTLEYIGGKLLVDKVANIESVLFADDNNNSQLMPTLNVSDTATINKIVLNNFIENGMLYTNSSGEIVSVGGSEGSVMQVGANGAPVFADLNGGVF